MKYTNQVFKGYTIIEVEVDTRDNDAIVYITESLNDLGQTANHKVIVSYAEVINHSEWDECIGTRFIVLTNQGASTIESVITDIAEYVRVYES